MRRAQDYLGVAAGTDWTAPFYQAANRLTFLYYLRARRSIPAWLFSIYFIGDAFEVDERPRDCPADETGWRATLDEMHAALGLPACHPLSHFAADVFLEAAPDG